MNMLVLWKILSSRWSTLCCFWSQWIVLSLFPRHHAAFGAFLTGWVRLNSEVKNMANIQSKHKGKPLEIVCLTLLWLQHTWHYPDEAWRVLTPCFFLPTPCLFSSCQSQELMDATKGGRVVADQRHMPQVRTGVWVHCHAGMGAVPGAQLRGVALAHTYINIYIYVSTSSLLGCVEILSPWEGRRSGPGGVSVQTRPCIAVTLNRRSEKVKRGSVWRWGSEVMEVKSKFFMLLSHV